MIIIKLKEAKLAYERRTGKRLTYGQLAERTGIPKDTLSAMGTRKNYNASLARLSIICRELAVTPGELLDLPEPERTRIAALREAWASGSEVDSVDVPEKVEAKRKRKRGKSAKKTEKTKKKTAKWKRTKKA